MAKQILKGYQRKGKKFIAPWNQYHDIQDVSWHTNLIPELLWVALINENYGEKDGAEISNSLSLLTQNTVKKFSKPNETFVFMNYFFLLNAEEKEEIFQNLGTTNLYLIQKAIEPLVSLYPKCPLKFLYKSPMKIKKDKKNFTIIIKNVLEKLGDRRNRFSMLVQSNVVYMYFIVGKLFAFKGSELENLREMKFYPDTDLSQKVGSSIRATLNSFAGFEEKNSDWRKYFWSRSLQLEEIKIINYYGRE